MITEEWLDNLDKLVQDCREPFRDVTSPNNPNHAVDFGDGFGAVVDFECGAELDFIIESRTAVPKLIDAVRRLSDELKSRTATPLSRRIVVDEVFGKKDIEEIIPISKIKKVANGLDPKLSNPLLHLSDLLNRNATKNCTYVFKNNIKDYAESCNMSHEVAEFSFMALHKFGYVKKEQIIMTDSLFHILSEEDVDSMNKNNIVHHPEDPDIHIEDPLSKVREAFVIPGLKDD